MTRIDLISAFVICAVCVAPWAPTAVDAQAPATYQQIIEQAVREYSAHNYAHAAELFEEAQRVNPNARNLRGWGKATFEQQRYREAVAHFEAALASQVLPLDTDMRHEVEALRDEARVRLAHEAPAQKHVPTPESPPILAVSPQAAAISVTPPPPAHRPPFEERERWLLPTGVVLGVGGLATTGAGLAFFVSHLDDGDKLGSATDEVAYDRYALRWTNSRTRTFAVAGVGAGLMTLGAGALAAYIPRDERKWLSPTLAAAGGILLASGAIMYAANRGCSPSLQGNSVAQCVTSTDRADAGSIMAMLSAPLLTIPLIHAVDWLLSEH
jgi:hypothetical protein